LKGLLALDDWYGDEAVVQAMKGPLLRLCAHYLLNEKRSTGRTLDPVEHFHLSNGARVERLDWAADLSPKGLRQSAGIMINYLYRLAEIEENHEAYTGEGRVTASSALSKLAKN
jgi:malonyl-CoA decarboxylase